MENSWTNQRSSCIPSSNHLSLAFISTPISLLPTSIHIHRRSLHLRPASSHFLQPHTSSTTTSSHRSVPRKFIPQISMKHRRKVRGDWDSKKYFRDRIGNLTGPQDHTRHQNYDDTWRDPLYGRMRFDPNTTTDAQLAALLFDTAQHSGGSRAYHTYVDFQQKRTRAEEKSLLEKEAKRRGWSVSRINAAKRGIVASPHFINNDYYSTAQKKGPNYNVNGMVYNGPQADQYHAQSFYKDPAHFDSYDSYIDPLSPNWRQGDLDSYHQLSHLQTNLDHQAADVYSIDDLDYMDDPSEKEFITDFTAENKLVPGHPASRPPGLSTPSNQLAFGPHDNAFSISAPRFLTIQKKKNSVPNHRQAVSSDEENLESLQDAIQRGSRNRHASHDPLQEEDHQIDGFDIIVPSSQQNNDDDITVQRKVDTRQLQLQQQLSDTINMQQQQQQQQQQQRSQYDRISAHKEYLMFMEGRDYDYDTNSFVEVPNKTISVDRNPDHALHQSEESTPLQMLDQQESAPDDESDYEDLHSYVEKSSSDGRFKGVLISTQSEIEQELLEANVEDFHQITQNDDTVMPYLPLSSRDPIQWEYNTNLENRVVVLKYEDFASFETDDDSVDNYIPDQFKEEQPKHALSNDQYTSISFQRYLDVPTIEDIPEAMNVKYNPHNSVLEQLFEWAESFISLYASFKLSSSDKKLFSECANGWIPFETLAKTYVSSTSLIAPVAQKWREHFLIKTGEKLTVKAVFDILYSETKRFHFKRDSMCPESHRMLLICSGPWKGKPIPRYKLFTPFEWSEKNIGLVDQMVQWATNFVPLRAKYIREQKMGKFHSEAGNNTIPLEIIYNALRSLKPQWGIHPSWTKIFRSSEDSHLGLNWLIDVFEHSRLFEVRLGKLFEKDKKPIYLISKCSSTGRDRNTPSIIGKLLSSQETHGDKLPKMLQGMEVNQHYLVEFDQHANLKRTPTFSKHRGYIEENAWNRKLFLEPFKKFIKSIFPEDWELEIPYSFQEGIPIQIILENRCHPAIRRLGRTRISQVEITDERLNDQSMQHILKRLDSHQQARKEPMLTVREIFDERKNLQCVQIQIIDAYFSCLNMIRDIVHDTSKSIVIVGDITVGKTSILREFSRVSSEYLTENVVVVDTHGEVGGYSRVSHARSGTNRRLWVKHKDRQEEIIDEGAKNHVPDTLIVDDISTANEVHALLRAKFRGIRVIAGTSVHNFWELLESEDLRCGFIDTSFRTEVMDEEVRMRSKPLFDIVLEVVSPRKWIIHHSAREHGCLWMKYRKRKLRYRGPSFVVGEMREMDPEGQIFSSLVELPVTRF